MSCWDYWTIKKYGNCESMGYSLNASCEIAECLETTEDTSSTNNMHNEEKKSRIPYDQVDQDILHKKSEASIDIFDICQTGGSLVNRRALSKNFC